MNIGILIPTLKTGGAERVASELGDYLSVQGNNVYYLLLANSGRNFFDVSGEVIKTHITYPFVQSSARDNIREMIFAATSLKKIKKQYKIDVCISFMEGCNILNVCSRTAGEKVIISVRTILSARKEYDGIFLYRKNFLKNIYRFANKIVAVSDGVRKDLIINYDINERKTMTIPNVSECHESNQKEGVIDSPVWSYGNNAIVCVGRMDPVKQFDSVIRAFSMVYKTKPDARLIFVGDGIQMNYMRHITRILGLENSVTFAGFQKDVGLYLKNAKCFVMASKAEGFPNAMVEAMAYGVPIISTDSPGGCGEILGRIRVVKDVELCKYGIMTPYIYRQDIGDEIITVEEEILGKAMLEMLVNGEINEHYSRKSFERSEYFSRSNVMSMWDRLINN